MLSKGPIGPWLPALFIRPAIGSPAKSWRQSPYLLKVGYINGYRFEPRVVDGRRSATDSYNPVALCQETVSQMVPDAPAGARDDYRIVTFFSIGTHPKSTRSIYPGLLPAANPILVALSHLRK